MIGIWDIVFIQWAIVVAITCAAILYSPPKKKDLTEQEPQVIKYSTDSFQTFDSLFNRTGVFQGQIEISAEMLYPGKGASRIDEIWEETTGMRTRRLYYRYAQAAAGISGAGTYYLHFPKGLKVKNILFSTFQTRNQSSRYFWSARWKDNTKFILSYDNPNRFISDWDSSASIGLGAQNFELFGFVEVAI